MRLTRLQKLHQAPWLEEGQQVLRRVDHGSHVCCRLSCLLQQLLVSSDTFLFCYVDLISLSLHRAHMVLSNLWLRELQDGLWPTAAPTSADLTPACKMACCCLPCSPHQHPSLLAAGQSCRCPLQACTGPRQRPMGPDTLATAEQASASSLPPLPLSLSKSGDKLTSS